MTTKTKILISILAVGIIIIGAFWILENQKEVDPKRGIPDFPQILEEITIATDKTEYEQEDMVTVVMTNKKEVSIFYSFPPFMLYKYKDDRWETFLYPWREGFNKPQVEVVPPFEEIEPGSTEMKANLSKDFNDLVDTKWMISGRYKIEFQYTLDSDKEELETIFSNEFTIK